MLVTKEQIKNGIVRYMDEEIVKKVNDKTVKMMANVVTTILKNNDRVLDNILNTTLVHLLTEVTPDDMYNIEPLLSAMTQTMDQYGTFDVKIPLLKYPFSFNKNDIDSLRGYIEGSVNNAQTL